MLPPAAIRRRPAMQAFACLLLGLLAGGCASYTKKTEELRQAWAVGDTLTAAQEAQSEADDSPTGIDALLWRLEEGSGFRYANDYVSSNQAFEQAEDRVRYYDKQAEISVSEEFLATITNLSTLPYRGTAYDRIMLNTYKALNYLSLGDPEAARVELNRALDRQREAVAENAKAIADAEQLADDASARSRSQPQDAYNVNAAERDRRYQNQLSSAYVYLNQYQAYSNYVNPFTVYLEGLYFMTNGLSYGDFERARKALQRAYGMHQGNRYLMRDLAQVESLIAGEPLPATTYVIFESGMAPTRREIRIDIPLFIVTREVPYVGVAFPQLQFNNRYIRGLNVSADGQSYSTELLCDMDAIVAQDFNNELPVIQAKTLISAGVKAGIQYGMYQAAGDNENAQIIAMIAGSIYAVSTNRADLRTWVTLPKKISYARLPRPSDGRVQISLQGGQQFNLSLIDAHVSVIYIKSNAPGAQVSVQQFPLMLEASADGSLSSLAL